MEPKRLWGSENCLRGTDESVGPGCIVVQQVRINEKKVNKSYETWFFRAVTNIEDFRSRIP